MGSKKKKGSANKSQTPSTPHHIPLLQLDDVPQHVLQGLGQIFQEHDGLFVRGHVFHVSLQAREANRHFSMKPMELHAGAPSLVAEHTAQPSQVYAASAVLSACPEQLAKGALPRHEVCLVSSCLCLLPFGHCVFASSTVSHNAQGARICEMGSKTLHSA